MSRAIEEFGFRLSLGIQEVEEHLTEEEIADLERLAIEFVRRRKANMQNERKEEGR